jgi:Amt family ammonium transporter
VASLVLLALTRPALAAPLAATASSNGFDANLLAIGLTLLLPIGLILLGVAALSEDQATSAMTGALVAWTLAVVAYFAAGFAFQFGGVAVFHEVPGLEGLYWEYSLLDTSWGTGWGMIGLKGFLMLGAASTPDALTLFLSQLPLLGAASLVLYFALQGRAPRGVILLASLLMGSLIYPVTGNWAWASGWLANLGRNLSHGHGLVDAGGSSQVALVGAAATLAALLVFRAKPDETDLQPASMPPVHLPLLATLGAILMLIGWMSTAFMAHLPTAAGALPAPAMANMALAALGGGLSAGMYSWFTTGRLNSLMSARGVAAGLVVVAAGAPFVPAWSALAAGLAVGLLLPPLVFLFDHVLRLQDRAGILAIFGVPGLLGLLLPALFADGRYGAGWNGMGVDDFLDVAGQGVSGLWVASGFAADWPGQFYAQLIGAIAMLVWSLGLSWLLLQALAGLVRAWERTGLEFGAPPETVPVDDALLERSEEEVVGLVGD